MCDEHFAIPSSILTDYNVNLLLKTTFFLNSWYLTDGM